MTKLTMDYASIRFYINPPKDDKKSIYTEAVKRAYGDMSRRTLFFADDSGYKGSSKKASDRRQKLKDRITDLFFNEENGVIEENNIFGFTKQRQYDDWHKNMCKKVLEVFTTLDDEKKIPILATEENENDSKKRKETFSMGQAQKIVNMVWKYVYTFYQYFSAVNSETKKYSVEIESFSKIIIFLHAPIDYKVIEAVTKDEGQYNLNINAPKWPWSQLSYEEYFNFQKAIRKNLKQQGRYPFLWELESFPFN